MSGYTRDIPANQPSQLPTPKGAATILVINLDSTNTVDLAPTNEFVSGQTYTLGPGSPTNWPGGQTLWCRVTPGQTGSPNSVSVWAQPNGSAAPFPQPQPVLKVTTTSLPGATSGSPYAATLTSSDGVTPLTWSISSGSFPAGLSISTDGVISGTPTTVDAYSFTVQVKDSTGATATQPLSIIVAAGPGQNTVTFAYTGSTQTWTVPSGVTSVTVDLAGAQGGTWSSVSSFVGGLGGRVQGSIAVAAGDVLTIYVAGAGSYNSGSSSGGAGGYGWGTGGAGGDGYSTGDGGCGGGGSSAIVLGGTAQAVAAGGGGCTSALPSSNTSGYGGGTSGGAGEYATSASNGGGGGTQSAGGGGGSGGTYSGSAGSGADGGAGGQAQGSVGVYSGGGGGGGYYGGGGGSGSSDVSVGSDCGSGGGGSSLIPSGGSTTSGYQSGNGYVTLTYTT